MRLDGINKRKRGDEMSVLVKGMKMPKNCNECKMLSIHRIWGEPIVICEANDRELEETEEYERDEKRLFDCPFVEVLVPHGGLLDENDVIDAIHDRLHELQTHKEFQKKHGDIDLLGVMPYIAKISTVIEAEDGDAE